MQITLAMDGYKLNKDKIVSWWLKQNKIAIDDGLDYYNLSEQALEELIKKDYQIKGDFVLKNVMKATKLGAGMTEHDIQVKVVKYLKEHKIAHFAVPNGFVHNGGKIETARYINYMKAEGLKVGIPDIVLLLGNSKVAFLELKTPTGKPSEHQLKWKEWLVANGYPHKIAYGYDDAIEFIDELLESEE